MNPLATDPRHPQRGHGIARVGWARLHALSEASGVSVSRLHGESLGCGERLADANTTGEHEDPMARAHEPTHGSRRDRLLRKRKSLGVGDRAMSPHGPDGHLASAAVKVEPLDECAPLRLCAFVLALPAAIARGLLLLNLLDFACRERR